ncbi:MAG: phage holin family protein [Vicingaceae bacterium]
MIETNNIQSIIEESKEYLETKVEEVKLQAAENLSEGIAETASQLIIGGIAILFLFFFSIFIAIYIGSFLDSYWYGFGIVSGFYFLLLILFGSFKKSFLKLPIQNSVIKHFFKNLENE